MRLEFEITPEDLRQLRAMQWKRFIANFLWNSFLALNLLLAAVLLPQGSGYHTYFGTLGVALILYSSWAYASWPASQWSRFKAGFGPQDVEVDDAEVTIRSSLEERRTKWERYTSYQESKNLIVLWRDEIGYMAIPKRAFTSAEVFA